ncbi:MAG: thiamine phosphate synthase [Magnetococcales bacterium]|nr:thiamine phosphate synthase [Magnetococcales bacterium]
MNKSFSRSTRISDAAATGGHRPSLHPPRLLLITDHAVRPDIENAVSQALQGGPFDLLLRDKTASRTLLTQLARRLILLLTPSGGRLIVHEHLEIALDVGAAGAHLPEMGMETTEARRILGPHPLLGRSCHHTENACQHLHQGGDYVTLSPVFRTASHPDASPLGLERFSRMCAVVDGPVLALGGVNTDNAWSALQAGASGVALIRGVLNAPDPGQTIQTMLTYISRS